MQFIQLAHEGEIGGGHRTRQVINAAPADTQGRRLLCNRQSVLAIDHRFALSRPALVSAPSKKSFSSVSSPILACKLFKSTLGTAASLLSWPNTPAAPSRSWLFRLGDLIGVDVELLRQFGQRLLPLNGGQSHLRLEARCVVPARSL